MTARASAEQVVGGMFPVGSEWFPFVPVVRSASAVWTSERVMHGHEPSRASVALWVPWWAADRMAPQHDDRCQIAVDVRGVHTPVFVGYVDGVARRRRKRGRASSSPLPAVHGPLGGAATTVQYVWTGVDGITRTSSRMVTEAEAGEVGPSLRYKHWLNEQFAELWDDTKPYTYRVLLNYSPFQVPAGHTALVIGGWAPGPEMRHGYNTPLAHRARIVGTGHPTQRPNVRPYTYTGQRPSDLAFEIDLNPGETASLMLPRAVIVPDGHDRNVPGYWYEVTASDVLGPAGRHRVGDEPWPSEPITKRLARLNNLAAEAGVPVRQLDDDPLLSEGGAITARPRDIDAKSLIELYRPTAATLAGYPTTDAAGRLCLGRLEDQPVAITQLALGDPVPVVSATVADLPLSTVPELPEAYTVADIVNRWTVNYTGPDDTDPDPTKVVERTYPMEWAPSVRRWGPHAETIDTEAYAFSREHLETMVPNLMNRLQRAGAALSSPAWRTTDPLVFDADRTDQVMATGHARPPTEGGFLIHNGRRLIDVETRHGALARIRTSGAVPTYSVQATDEFYRVRAGRVDVEGNRVRMELTLEPAAQAGVPGANLGDLAGNASRTLAWWAKLPALTLETLAQIEA